MTLNATCVGELVRSLADSGARGRVRRIFRNSAYLESRGGLALLLRGDLRSPMTVNLAPGPEFTNILSIKQAFELGHDTLDLGELEIRLDGAPTFSSSLMDGRPTNPIAEADVVRGATALKLLYSASQPSLELVSGRAFGEFASSVLEPFAHGKMDRVYFFRNYVGLIGNGSGFTPAGDDLVAGFTAAFNHYAKGTDTVPISLPLTELKKRTVNESASLLDYAQRGYVDEGLERLILSGLGNKPVQFRAELSELASRGHTSGLDMSLGVLSLVAVLGDYIRHGTALESSLAAIGD